MEAITTARLVGFANRLQEFPAAMCGIVEKESGHFYWRWPSTDEELLVDIRCVDDIRGREWFYVFQSPQTIDEGEIVFAFTPTDVFVGTKAQVCDEIRKRMRDPLSPAGMNDILREYLKDEK